LELTKNTNDMKSPFILPVSVTGFGAFAIALGLMTSPLNASDKDDQAKKDSGQPDMEAMMKKMQELAAPGPEHKALALLAGEWEAEAKCSMMGADTVNKGSCTKKMILGGRYLKEEFDGEMMGNKFHGISITGYDKFNKKFVNNWIDDMGTGFFVSEGTADADFKAFTLEGKMDDPATGEKQKSMRLLTRIVSPDKHMFEMHDLSLGDKSKVMEITYTRKAGSAAGSLSTTGREKP